MDLNPSAINTALITVTMFALGLVSFVLRSVLNNLSIQMQGLIAGFATAMASREGTMREVQQMIDTAKKSTDERVERLTRAMELSARSELLRIIGSPDIRPEVKEQARVIIDEIANGQR